MALKAHQLVGLANPVYLPDDIAVDISIVPSAVFQVRSNQKRSAAEVRYVTRHETGNDKSGADADMHKRYLHGGPVDAKGSPIYAGYNCVSDDKKVIQLTPYDEVTWAAGTVVGNRTSDHHELCVHKEIDHTKAHRIAAALDAGVLHARGLTVTAALLQHHYWYGKNCPALMRANNNAIWNNSYYPMVKQFYADIEAFVSSGVPVNAEPIPSYAPAVRIRDADGNDPVAFTSGGAAMILAPMTVRSTRPTPRKQYASDDSAEIGPVIPGGTEFAVRRLIVNADGTEWWYTPYGTRVKRADTKIVGGL